jgi:hypothetical protein
LKRIVFIAFTLVFIFTSSYAQKQTPQNLVFVDDKPLHFGFTLGIHTQDFGITPSGVTDAQGKVWYGELQQRTPGFTVGIISDFRIIDDLSLRFVPTLNFGDRLVTFSGFQSGQKVDEFNTEVLSTLLSFPVYVKYRAQRINNYRPYVIAGAGMTLDLSRNQEIAILLKPTDFFVEFGVGCDLYLPYFKLAPEFKMCLGLNDMLERDRPLLRIDDELKYTQAISHLTSRLFVLTFNFE